MRVVPGLRVVSAIHPRQDKGKEKNSETSSLAFLSYTSAQLEEGI